MWYLLLQNTIVMHNTCEDSLLAVPLIIDLAILCEVSERIKVRANSIVSPPKINFVNSRLLLHSCLGAQGRCGRRQV